jgi:hypothetical protein
MNILPENSRLLCLCPYQKTSLPVSVSYETHTGGQKAMRPFALFLTAQAISSAAASCRNYKIEVEVERTTRETFQGRPYSIKILHALAAKEILVSNSYTLDSRSCLPSSSNASLHSDTIQLLVHGASFNKIMWDFPYQPARYSWVQRMSDEGYPTIAVDLIGQSATYPSIISTDADCIKEAETVRFLTAFLRPRRKPMSKTFTRSSKSYVMARSTAKSGSGLSSSASLLAPLRPIHWLNNTPTTLMPLCFTAPPGMPRGSIPLSCLDSRHLPNRSTRRSGETSRQRTRRSRLGRVDKRPASRERMIRISWSRTGKFSW